MAIGNLLLSQSTGAKTASTLVKTGQGGVQKIICTASSTGIIAIFDGIDTTGVNMTGSFTLSANNIYTFDLGFGTGCYVQLVSGTATFAVTYL